MIRVYTKNTHKRILLILTIILNSILISENTYAQFTITENFKGSSVGSNIILGGNPVDARLTSGSPDPVNEGWLRLTNDNTQQRGYAYIDTPFPATLGVYIDFEYKTWRTKSDSHNGADGIAVFLFDATSPFRIGAWGGALGYANMFHDNVHTPGLGGGYMGIGLDEYGNFANASEGKNGGTSGLAPNSIVLRGPENHSSPYRYIASKQMQPNRLLNENSVDYNTVGDRRPTDNEFYRRVKIYIEPIGTPQSPVYNIRVLWRTSINGDDVEIINVDTTDPIPASLKLGFSASTGGGFNYHEIRNLLITTPGGVRVHKSVDKDNVLVDEQLTYKIDVYNETTAALTGLELTDNITLANGDFISPDDFEITSITFHNNGYTNNTAHGFPHGVPVTGFTHSFSTALNMDATSMSYFTVTGNVKRVPEGGVLTNSVSIDHTPTGITDADLTNNYSSVTSSVLNPNIDLKIEKGVDNNGIAKLSGNTFTIVVSNMSSANKPAGQIVTVEDEIPAGLDIGTINASGWNVSNSGRNYTFTRGDTLGAQMSFPPITINVTPSQTVTGPWTNTATVNYANDTNLNNNTSSATLQWVNYWLGGTAGKVNDWAEPNNWTANFVPGHGQDVEFATEANNPTVANNPKSGPAKEDLHLDMDRVIGNLINASDKDLIITTSNELVINGTVQDGDAENGTIIVKADPEDVNPSGTLRFQNPLQNRNVQATVEFYSKAYDCADCGFYTRSWQYFGIPVNISGFPYDDVAGNETVNQWVEPFNGDKWLPAPYSPDTELKAFKGYQITNDANDQPEDVYSFTGTLNVGNIPVPLTHTTTANYAGVNLVGNSYTAAIPIKAEAFTFPTGVEHTVYLFNTGTRDEWRKLSGSTINQNGYCSGQYLAVPVNLANQTNANLPDRIPSMHSFMLLANSGTGNIGNLTINYNQLIKNTTVNLGDGTQIVTRSAGNSTKQNNAGSQSLPSLIMDVIGGESADRLWIFTKEGTTRGFDNGWDGRKFTESGIAQLYATDDIGEDRFQISTVPALDNLKLGFNADIDGEYTIEFALSGHLSGSEIYLHDLLTNNKVEVRNGGSYTFRANKSDSTSRFSLSASDGNPTLQGDEAIIEVSSAEGKIINRNGSEIAVSVFISNMSGGSLNQVEVSAGKQQVIDNLPSGNYIVRLQNAELNDVRRVVIR